MTVLYPSLYYWVPAELTSSWSNFYYWVPLLLDSWHFFKNITYIVSCWMKYCIFTPSFTIGCRRNRLFNHWVLYWSAHCWSKYCTFNTNCWPKYRIRYRHFNIQYWVNYCIRPVPSQDVLFALILWYVAKTLYLS